MSDKHHHSAIVHAKHAEHRDDHHPESFHALTAAYHAALKAAGYEVVHHHSIHHGTGAVHDHAEAA